MAEPIIMSSTLAQDAVIPSPLIQGPAGQLVVLCCITGDLTISKYCVQCPGMAKPILMSSTLAQDAVILSPSFQGPAGHIKVLCSTNGELTIFKYSVQCPSMTEPTLMSSILAQDAVILPHPSRALLVNSNYYAEPMAT